MSQSAKHSTDKPAEVESLDDDNWRRLAKEMQNEVFLMVDYHWLLFKKSEREFLEMYVQFILYELHTTNNDEKVTVKKLSNLIIKEGNRGQCLSDETCMSFIYIVCRGKSEVARYPIFKVPKSKDDDNNNACFIDIEGRIYASWKDFLNNNKIPPCEYCYPKNGAYCGDEDDKVIIEFDQSPASKSSRSVTRYVNAAVDVVSVASLGALFLPISGPVAAGVLVASGVTGVYSGIRSASTLYDRKTHKQSINLKDSESRLCWLSIGASIIGPASTFGKLKISKLAMSGQVVGRMGRVAVTSLEMGNCAFSALGILNNLAICKEKRERNELSPADVAHFTASVLLFAHAAIKIETAESIIRNTQENVIEEFRNSLRSNRHKKMFNKLLKSTNGEGTIPGNAKVIKSLSFINDTDDFFSSLVRMRKQFGPTQSKATFAEGGGIHVNENLRIDPSLLVKMCPKERIKILDATKKFADCKISQREFQEITDKFIESLQPVGGTMKPVTNRLNFPEFFIQTGKHTQSSSSKVIFCLNAQEKQYLWTLLEVFADHHRTPIMKLVYYLMVAMGMKSGKHYLQVASIVCGLIRSIALAYSNNSSDVATTSKHSNYSINQDIELALQNFAENSDKLKVICEHIKSLYDIFTETVPTNVNSFGLRDIAELANVLLVMDTPLWLRVLKTAEKICLILNLSKAERMLSVVKGLCLYLQQSAHDRVNTTEHCSDSVLLKGETSRRKEILRNDFSINLDILSADDGIWKSFINEIQKYVAETSSK